MECPACGYDKWDGKSAHWFAGRESSRVNCFGRVKGLVASTQPPRQFDEAAAFTNKDARKVLALKRAGVLGKASQATLSTPRRRTNAVAPDTGRSPQSQQSPSSGSRSDRKGSRANAGRGRAGD